MTAASLISICIPTFKRPDLLSAALQSCFAQTYQDFEIVVGDDSPDYLSASVVEYFADKYPGIIQYFHNIPALRQDGNVNLLFARARGERLVLLHDDDLLLPNALQDLAACWLAAPHLTAAFGKQHEMDMNGTIINRDSRSRQKQYDRIRNKAGLLAVPAEAGLVQMFPNDGFMVRTDAARRVGYRPRELVDHACDYDFGLRLCLDAAGIYVLDRFVAIYRFTDDALSQEAMPNPFVYRLLRETKIPENAVPAYREAMAFFMPRAVSEYVRLGQGGSALAILLSKDYPRSEDFGAKFLFYFFLALVAMVTGERGGKFFWQMRRKLLQNKAAHRAAAR